MASARTSAGPERRYRQLRSCNADEFRATLPKRQPVGDARRIRPLMAESACRRSGLAASVLGETRRAFCSVCSPPSIVGAARFEVRADNFPVAFSLARVGPCAAVLDPSVAAGFVSSPSGCVDGCSGSDVLGAGTFAPVAAVGPCFAGGWSASAGVLDASTVLGASCGPGVWSANQMPAAARAAATAALERIIGTRLDLMSLTMGTSPGSTPGGPTLLQYLRSLLGSGTPLWPSSEA